jgi:hypothetical protein
MGLFNKNLASKILKLVEKGEFSSDELGQIKQALEEKEDASAVDPNQTEENKPANEDNTVANDENKDAHPNIDGDKPTETADEIKEEAKTETVSDEASESADEQAGEENALLDAVDEEKQQEAPKTNDVTIEMVNEIKNTIQSTVARLSAIEEVVSKLSVTSDSKGNDDGEEFGLSGNGKMEANDKPSNNYMAKVKKQLGVNLK